MPGELRYLDQLERLSESEKGVPDILAPGCKASLKGNIFVRDHGISRPLVDIRRLARHGLRR